MIFKSILQIPKKLASHPMGRGMMAYGLTFPTGCLIQEYCNKKNLGKCVQNRFTLYLKLLFISSRERQLEKVLSIFPLWYFHQRSNCIRLDENCE